MSLPVPAFPTNRPLLRVVASWLGIGVLVCASVTTGYAAQAPVAGAPDPLAYEATRTTTSTVGPAYGAHGMVVSAQHLASEVGARILASGGNAADAAVAMGYALAVVYPAAGNIGGGGFMVLRPPHEDPLFINFRERAPLAATPTMFQDAQGHVRSGESVLGWKAVAVPGTVAGLDYVHARWGKLSRQKVMEPAIRLAREGFRLEEGDVALLRTADTEFKADPVLRPIFTRPNGASLEVGDRLVQRDLAHSLTLIARQGPDAFYRGEISRRIVEASTRNDGLLSAADFSSYRPTVSAPLTCSYRGYRIDTAPPPSGGGIALCEMLDILSGYDLKGEGLHSAIALHQEIEAMRHAYSDRRDLGDPAFVANPIAHLLDANYAAQVRKAIPVERAIDSSMLTAGVAAPGADETTAASDHEKKETTQFSVMDQTGFAISTTYTLNGWFGARVMAPGTGILLNDEMDDFSVKPGSPNMFGIVGSTANAIAPRKTPLSSMTPTLLSHDGHTVMVIGSPGGSRIPTIVLSVVSGVIDYGLDIQQAIDLPRLHEQWMPSIVEIERGAVSASVARTLADEGYTLTEHAPWGIPEGIVTEELMPHVGGVKNGLYGGVDRRHPGGAAVGE
ncbi:gamma-glutamyltranspeptidase [Acetobacter estunensis NRIC 0472]|uniref:Glutathione hydrolase proenzyme n=1 Tax=Acetobacter estunensis TaxID=104097 RepID=A0A967B4F6_9PROT|nr:gamma-glutamyltransferase [Acetobacter estunensis]NHO53570.1 gamma-glutamyltransferase [Acetobacter estunensis]GBQ21078.1 gamma-glutamyltranspeptidase [Acetobacter estunensis NRIC 0472]